MNLEQQVCSLDLAKRLKELGCTQWSAFYWVGGTKGYVLADSDRGHRTGIGDRDFYPAFTVAELGEMLPDDIHSGLTVNAARVRGKWICCKAELDDDGVVLGYFDGHGEFANTEADARAKMLVYLIEKKLINLP